MHELNLRPQDFRARLQQELIDRCRKNPKYSMRAFAKALQVQSSALAEMLSGKRNITKKSIEKLGFGIGLNLQEINAYLENKNQNKISSASQKDLYREITLDQYALISDWYHFAIIELIKVEDFQTSHSWIAQALGITKSEVNIAVERLLRLGLLEKDETGSLKDTSSGFSTNISGTLTSTGSRQLQKQILEKSIETLITLPIDVRNHTSMTMAINPKHLPEAVKRIAKFRRELCEYLESQGEATEVYQLSLSLFPLTKIKDTKVRSL